MTCFEAQSRITDFMNNKLSIKELENFLNHVNHCEECMEELEVYYTLFTGMKLLDDQRNIDNNFQRELYNMLHWAEERIVREKIRVIRKGILLFLAVVVVAITL